MIPLRILHAVPSLDSMELQAAQPLLTALAAAGHQLALLMPLAPAPAAPAAPVVSPAGLPLLTYTSGWWRWWRHERATTVRQVATWTPDLLHVHGLANLPATLDIARNLGLSVIITLHHAEEPYAARRLRDPLVAWVLVPTEHHRAHCLSRNGLTRDRIAIVPMGVDLQPAPLVSPLASDWIIGCIDGGERPALRRWLMAVAEIQHAGLPLAARLFTQDRQPARELADDLACQVTVTDEGNTTDFIATCDALAIPGTHECHPLLPLTAMAAGKPLIAVAAGGLPELVRDGQTAVLIAADDTDALADAMRHLHDRGRRQQMGDAASVVVEAVAAVYRSALGDTGAGDKAEITTTWRRLTEKNSASYASAALPES
jgi:glycosyltransferase involved in cell wall biosynthesis